MADSNSYTFTRAFGRHYIEDVRDKDYPMRTVAPSMEEVDRTWRYWWTRGWWGDQGQTPQCVAYSWLHWLEDGPHTAAPRTPGEGPALDPTNVYRRAQRLDQWPGEDYNGTSVRAGAKVLQEESFISEYRWAQSPGDAIGALLTTGPVVVGSWWWTDMMYPDSQGRISVSGIRQGGHAYIANGVNVERRVVRIKNSWGRMWGRDGYAYMSLDDFAYLLEDQGEACLAIRDTDGEDN